MNFRKQNKNKQMKLHPTKTLLPSKGNNQQSKTQPKDLEKIFPNCTADKGVQNI